MAKGSARQRKKLAKRGARQTAPQSQKSKDIKRINERFADIRRKVAKGLIPQGVADRYADAMRAAAGDYILPSGNISHSKGAELGIKQDALDALLERETAATAQRHIDKQIREEFGGDYTDEERENYFKDMTFVTNYISEHKAESYDAFAAAFTGVPGRKSYTELSEAILVSLGPSPAVEENPFDPVSFYFK